jgi:hypothetical protein
LGVIIPLTNPFELAHSVSSCLGEDEMSAIERAILNDLLNGLESLAVAVDSIEAVLNRKGLCTIAEIQSEKLLHVQEVANRLASVRTALASLGS